MPIKKFKPTTPSNRFTQVNAYTELTGGNNPEKSLLVSKKSTGGRNSRGEMTMRYRGGGHKKKFRVIDFKRDKHNIPATVASVEYDPNRTAFIALLNYADGEKRYILAPAGITVGAQLLSGAGVTPDLGNSLPLSDIPLGTTIHNIELKPGKGGAMARSAGSSAQLSAKEGKYCIVKLPSGETRMVLSTCMATIGAASNPDHSLISLGKAGRNRWKGIRPRTRPVAMNPVDHPMGGGEGRASGGHPRSRRGLKAKGAKTRKPKNPTSKFIISKRKTVNNQQ
jgi:large subunit ribosomal protein L2